MNQDDSIQELSLKQHGVEITPTYFYNSCAQLRQVTKDADNTSLDKVAVQDGGSCEEKLYTDSKTKKIRASRKYEVLVIYSSNKSKKLRVRKVKFGFYGEADKTTVSAEQVGLLRDKYQKLLVDHEGFDHSLFVKCGGFFNTKFWDLNMSWGANQNVEDSVALLDKFLKQKYSGKN